MSSSAVMRAMLKMCPLSDLNIRHSDFSSPVKSYYIKGSVAELMAGKMKKHFGNQFYINSAKLVDLSKIKFPDKVLSIGPASFMHIELATLFKGVSVDVVQPQDSKAHFKSITHLDDIIRKEIGFTIRKRKIRYIDSRIENVCLSADTYAAAFAVNILDYKGVDTYKAVKTILPAMKDKGVVFFSVYSSPGKEFTQKVYRKYAQDKDYSSGGDLVKNRERSSQDNVVRVIVKKRSGGERDNSILSGFCSPVKKNPAASPVVSLFHDSRSDPYFALRKSETDGQLSKKPSMQEIFLYI